MEGKISILFVLLACVTVTLGFRVHMPYYESSLESVAEYNAQPLRNNPGLLLLHGPVAPSSDVESEYEQMESEPVESESEPVESDPAVNNGQAVQANPDAFGGAGGPMAVPGGQGFASGQAAGPAIGFGGNPHQISSAKGSAAVGVGVAVAACFLVAVAVGVAAYIFIQQRRNRNMERLE